MNKYNIYVLNNQRLRANLTREEVINRYNELLQDGVNEKDINIYCSTKDYYPKGQGLRNSFLNEFLNSDSILAKIYYDENAVLLENTLRGLKFRHNGTICFVKDNKIEYIN